MPLRLLNSDNERPVEVAEGIFSVLDESRQQSNYDGRVVGYYDTVIGNRFYNRLLWGNWPSDYQRFCELGLEHSNGKPVLDVGCGSLVFTAQAYAQSNQQDIVLLDRSLGMLKRAKERLSKVTGKLPSNITFLQADVFNLPFEDNTFGSVMSHALLHMFKSKAEILNELERVTHTSGSISATSLVSEQGLGRHYLTMLEKAGQVSKSLNSNALKKVLEQQKQNYSMRTQGNMAFIKSV